LYDHHKDSGNLHQQSPTHNEQALLEREAAGEKRAHTRKLLRTHAKLMLADQQVIAVRTKDISMGGVAVVSPTDLKPGTVVVVQFSLPILGGQRRPFLARAEVANSVLSAADQGFKLGLRFHMSDATSAALAQMFSLL
jgi:PilZ domain